MSTRRKPAPKSHPQNLEMAKRAVEALNDNDFVTEPSMCMAFVRQVVQSLYGSAYNSYFYRGTAEGSRKAFETSPYAVNPRAGSVVGDILFKAPTPNVPEGHVGIRIPGNHVAENSIVHKHRANGAKGVRSLEDFGRVVLIVRLRDSKDG